MEIVQERCAGLDVHKRTVVACVITPEHKEVRTFGTMTRELMGMADWFSSLGVTHVAMESTGVYWRAVFNLLEGRDFELLVANPRYMRAVPGRKTDVKDAEWIADLLRHGLLRASFVPEKGQRELRDLVRYRKVIGQERARMVVRSGRVRESPNTKLPAAASPSHGPPSPPRPTDLFATTGDP